MLSPHFPYIISARDAVNHTWQRNLSFHGPDSSSETKVIHKRVGDTVELSSPYANNDITSAYWKFGRRVIASNYLPVKPTQLTKKVFFNPSNFSLTVKALTVHDSGNFIFVPEMNGAHGKSITITLQVHGKTFIIHQINTSHLDTNLSCTVLLECNANANHSTIYTWTTRNQTTTGSKLQYFHTPQGEKNNFSCMISNDVHHKSALTVWTCSNQTLNKVTGMFINGSNECFGANFSLQNVKLDKLVIKY
uniref:Ig-like domain-containing protein n=1 Tax=Gouania willdenowi TaxID=441366 RepID=A0A8C5GM78_GOUWI